MNEDFLSAIGAVTVEFAVLEQQVHSAVWSLLVGTRLEHQQTGRLVTADRSFGRSVDLFESLVSRRFPKRDNSDAQAVCKRAKKIEEKRNLIVHSTWALAEEGAAMRIKTTARGQVNFLRMTAIDVRDIARDIHEAAEAELNLHLTLLQPDHAPVTL